MTKSQPPKSLVLYADDDPDDIELVTDAFKQYSQNVQLICFENGVELLTHLEKTEAFDPTPCLIILDINMPRLNGKEALKKIRQHSELLDVPAVLFTTSSLPADMSFAEKYNAGFITKPLEASQMDKVIRQFIEHCSEETQKKIRGR